MLEFHKISDFKSGTIKQLLHESYMSYHKKNPEYFIENDKSFSECNDFFYENINIGDNCCIITTYQDQVIGMCCWDPRKFPVAEIGHNCILPKYRGNGYGKKQLSYVIERLISAGFRKVKVSTGILDFYVPAQKQYESVGFHEIKRDQIFDNKVYQSSMIYYELNL